MSAKRDHLNRPYYTVRVNGFFIQYPEDDPRLLSGFEPDFPLHHEIDWSDYQDYRRPFDAYAQEYSEDWDDDDANSFDDEDYSDEEYYSDLLDDYEEYDDCGKYEEFLRWEQFCFSNLDIIERLEQLLAHPN